MSPDARTHDFDLHGVVGIRLLEAGPDDVAKVTRQLGPISSPLSAEPDIRIRFVDRLRTPALTYVEMGDTGFDGENFFVLRGKGGTRAKALIPFDHVGGSLEIVCERRLPVVPHLLTCINMVALTKGVLPLHASAFEQGGRGILVMGWAKGGKTEALLAHMDRGACYIGDEWVYLTPDGRMMGLPEPIRLWAWHLEQQPRVLADRRTTERLRLASWSGLASTARAVGQRGPVRGVARRVHPLLQRQAFLQIPPAELFGHENVLLQGRLDAAVLMLSHESDGIRVERADPDEISGRMAASLVHEREQFLTHYRQFRFAFPTRSSRAVESAAERERTLLRALFDGRQARKVSHPYPCDIGELGDAVAAAVDDLEAERHARSARL
jgi:hypothetical protein